MSRNHKHKFKLRHVGRWVFLFECHWCGDRHEVDKFIFRKLVTK